MAATQIVRIVPMALLCLVLLISTASAECAWVLWVNRFDLNGFLHSPIRAYSTHVECEAERDRQWAQEKASSARRGDKPGFALTCFPDTIDPRGPKGR